jgi:hypothetical protein
VRRNCPVAAVFVMRDTDKKHLMDFTDLTLVLFAFIVLWIALNLSGGGGGHRQRVPVRTH